MSDGEQKEPTRCEHPLVSIKGRPADPQQVICQLGEYLREIFGEDHGVIVTVAFPCGCVEFWNSMSEGESILTLAKMWQVIEGITDAELMPGKVGVSEREKKEEAADGA